MTPRPANPTFLKRVTNVTMIALCTASSLALLGAVRADSSKTLTPASPVRSQQATVPAIDTFGSAELASVGIERSVEAIPAGDELLEPVAARKSQVVRMEVTAYCPCTKCCGSNAQGITASGKLVDYNGGKFVAADTRLLPFGKKLVVPGYANGAPVEVIDRGGAIKGNKLDLYFPTHREALQWGRQHLNVTVYE